MKAKMDNSKDYQLASDFKPLTGEANFPPPIDKEVVGGMHIAPECITRCGKQKFVMIEWPNGLPRHENHRTVRFPHGLMKFGETVEECIYRLVNDQLGMTVDLIQTLYIDSYVDSMNHWHIEPWILVDVSGNPRLPSEASRVIYFEGSNVPEGAFWDEQSFKAIVQKYNL